MTKQCTRCRATKSVDDFHKNARKPDGLASACKACMCLLSAAAYAKTGKARTQRNTAGYRERNRQHVFDYLTTHPCVDCGEPDPIVLDFDHVRGEKDGNVSKMALNGVALAKLQAEIDKCDVRCANDHRRATAQRAGQWRTTAC